MSVRIMVKRGEPMKYLMISILTIFATQNLSAADSVYEFTVTSIQGEEVELSQYEGKTLLIVNTASRCGFTKQYADLVELQKMYADQDLVILGFPANNFGNQEPGSDEQILEFCSSTYGVDFPMFSKVSVKGRDQHPLFAYLTSAENESFTGNVRWNFEKFLVGPDGKLKHRFRSMARPTSTKVTTAIESLLAVPKS
jgi:glutathione peroxidase